MFNKFWIILALVLWIGCDVWGETFKTVCSDGSCDYVSPQAFETAYSTDFSPLDTVTALIRPGIYNEQLVVAGQTNMGAGKLLRFVCDANPYARVDTSTSCIIASNATPGVDVGMSYVQFERIQFHNNNAGRAIGSSGASTNNVKFLECVVKQDGLGYGYTYSAGTHNVIFIKTSFIATSTANAQYAAYSTAGAQFLGCSAYGFNQGFRAGIVKNSVAILRPGASGASCVSLAATSTNNAGSDASCTAGSGNLNNQTTSTVAWVDPYMDHHIDTSSTLNGAGSDLSGTFTHDVDSAVIASWPIGIDDPTRPIVTPYAPVSPGGSATAGAWPFYRQVTIGGLASEETNFQVKIPLERDSLYGVRHGYQDVRVCSGSQTSICASPLKHCFEDTAMANPGLWVKVPTLPTGGTTATLFWGNTLASNGEHCDSTFITQGRNWHPYADFLYNDSDVVVRRVATNRAMSPASVRDNSGKLWVFYNVIDTLADVYDATKACSLLVQTSTDTGATWSAASSVLASPDTNIFNVAAGYATYGGAEKILLVYQWGNSTATSVTYSRVYDIATNAWGSRVRIDPDSEMFTHGPPVQMSNGEWIVPLYKYLSGTYRSKVAISSNGGASWSIVTAFANASPMSEFNIEETSAGNLYGIVRADAAPSISYKITSADYGRTWSDSTRSQFVGGLPTRLKQVPGVGLFAFQGNNGNGNVYLSRDAGATFDTIAKWKYNGLGASLYPEPEIIDSQYLGLVWATNYQSGSGGQSTIHWSYYNIQRPGPFWYVQQGVKPTITNRKFTLTGDKKFHSVWERNGSDNPYILEARVRHNNSRTAIGVMKSKTNGDVDALNQYGPSQSLVTMTTASDAFTNGLASNQSNRVFRLEYGPDSVRFFRHGLKNSIKTPANGNGILDTLSWAYIQTLNSDAGASVELQWMQMREWSVADPIITLQAAQAVPAAASEDYLDIIMRRFRR